MDTIFLGVVLFGLAFTVLTFLTWFAGIGHVLTLQTSFAGVIILALAVLGGLFGSAVVFLVMVRLLLPGQTPPLRAEDFRLEGTLARVTIPMGGARTGAVIYNKHGTTRREGARSVDGGPLERATEVVVMCFEKAIAYVDPWTSFSLSVRRAQAAYFKTSIQRACDL